MREVLVGRGGELPPVPTSQAFWWTLVRAAIVLVRNRIACLLASVKVRLLQ